MQKRIAIVQSCYIPWKGYFDLINSVDEFILYDDAQYTKRDWRNRNKIKTGRGPAWLTIPVMVKGRFLQKIHETRIADPGWAREHWKAISQAYARAPHFKSHSGSLAAFYLGSPPESLSGVNQELTRIICGLLGIPTKVTTSMDYGVEGESASERLANLCVKAGAGSYLSGPLAKDYLDIGLFSSRDIKVEFFDYSGYPEYPQLHPPFTHFVSALDLIFNAGPRAGEFMKTRPSAAAGPAPQTAGRRAA